MAIVYLSNPTIAVTRASAIIWSSAWPQTHDWCGRLHREERRVVLGPARYADFQQEATEEVDTLEVLYRAFGESEEEHVGDAEQEVWLIRVSRDGEEWPVPVAVVAYVA
jgi:hypothetical protein